MSQFKPLLLSAVAFILMGLWSCVPANDISADLTEEELLMPEAKYYTTDFVPVPDELMDAIAMGSVDPEKAVPLEDVNELLKPGYLEMENGYALLEDNSAYVAVRTDFPGVTGDMIRWWFMWHPHKAVRYKIWCPGDHYTISVKYPERLANERLSFERRFLNNPHFPVEDVGQGVMNLRIWFIAPEKFGFDTTAFKKAGVEAVVCGIVGFTSGGVTIDHTYMCHIFRKKGDGLELRSRFWLGKKLVNPMIKKLFITEDLAMDMAFHCSKEYNHLAGFLPRIYKEFDGRVQ